MCGQRLDHILLGIFGALAFSFVSLALIGTYRAYSAVPYWDMWGGYLEFYMRIQAGDYSAWWEHHNEHRILLSRLLFWLDLAWFGGKSVFLLVVNLLLVGLSGALFWHIAKEQAQGSTGGRLVGLWLIAWLFFWGQSENLTWGFQSQFILAQQLPLLAFYCLSKTLTGSVLQIRTYWLAALTLGVLSSGTMANGILVLPLLALQAWLYTRCWRRVALITMLAGLLSFAYFYDYRAPPAHGSLSQALREDPIGLMQYVGVYLGGPFRALAPNLIALEVAQCFGLLLLAAWSMMVPRVFKRARTDSVSVALLIFLLYILGTALGTAGGRSNFGLIQATSSRYLTPVLMAWGALVLLLVPTLRSWAADTSTWTAPPFLKAVGAGSIRLKPIAVAFVMLGLGLILLGAFTGQLKALQFPGHLKTHEQAVAALALTLAIDDTEQINTVYPDAASALRIAQLAYQQKLSIFGSEPLAGLPEKMGTKWTQEETASLKCVGYVGHVDHVYTLKPVMPAKKPNPAYHRIRGWVYAKDSKRTPKWLFLVNARQRIVGIILTGVERPDVAKAVAPQALNAGFSGYIQIPHDDGDTSITALDPNQHCVVQL